MSEIDEDIREMEDQILTISGKRKLEILASTHYSDANSRLEMIARRLVEKVSPPVILWNVRPSNNFNLLHAIYLIKLKKCIDLGFNCTIIIYDKLIEKKLQVPPAEKALVQEDVKNCIRQFIKAGLKEDKTEFITESDIWSLIEFNNFAETVTTFSHICSFDPTYTRKEEHAQ